MDKYCPVEQIECEHVVGYFCNAINQCGYINFGHLKQCPWPERQVPVNNITTPKPRIINGLYIVDETPVEPKISVVEAKRMAWHEYKSGRHAGQAEAKREIVKAIPKFYEQWWKDHSEYDEPTDGDLFDYIEKINPTLDTVNAYQAGRNDMKREIGEKVDAIPHTFGDVSFNKKNVLAAIEGVK